MLRELTLRNFRCFERHVIPLRERTLIVGRNNAGKSTIVEALRLVSHVANRYGNFLVAGVPDWLDLPRVYRGISPSLRGMEFNAETLYHRYGEPPAQITATFNSGDRVELYIGGETDDPNLFAVVFDADGTVVTRRSAQERTRLSRVSILPQVAPLSRTERVLEDEYVKGAVGSSLTSLHFRNQIRLFPEHEAEFRRIAQETWGGLQVQGLSRDHAGHLLNPLLLMIRDGDFVAEVARMGHGLQMWLQTMWFLSRARQDQTIILDEPDVYMHADLQRRLIRFLRGRGQQVIIATHSIEIMAEVAPEDVLIVDRARARSAFAASLPVVQEVADRIGGIHNFQLARLWTSRRCLLVEGKDIGFLRAAHAALYPDAVEPIDALPRVELGGWSGFPYAIGSRMLLQNSGGEAIVPYCILDSDFHTAEEIAERGAAARRAGVQLHIWTRKEIENYFLVPSAIARFIAARQQEAAEQGQPQGHSPAPAQISEQLDLIVEQLREETTDGIAAEIYQRNRARGFQNANATARALVGAAWTSQAGKLGIVSGKETWARLSSWSQVHLNVSLSAMGVGRIVRADEILPEMRAVLTAIERGRPFPPSPS
jgi:energy-coupling factor transporter ATP-binding protein EcfA2